MKIFLNIVSRKLVKGAKIKALLKCNGIWVSGSKFGCTWRAEQIQISVPIWMNSLSENLMKRYVY